MSVAANQQRTFLRLLAALRPHWRRDPALPARIQAQLSRHREFGSRDRRLYRELIYTTLRYLPWIEPWLDSDPAEAVRRVAWLAAETPSTQAFRAALARGEAPTGDKTELLPAWFRAHCPEVFAGGELETQLQRAPVWLRLQTEGPQRVLDELDARGWRWRRSEILSDAIALLDEADVTTTDAWREGRLEVQDLGSQLILESVAIEPGTHWLDACAGAGGKTLQLARRLGPKGKIDAFDIRREALAELERRAKRARADCHSLDDNGLAGIRVSLLPPTGSYDGVLVDAPCSGSGTWRRAPHLKWVTTEAQIDEASAKQQRLLGEFSARVRPGGQLVYATCSLSARENEDVAAAFLAAHPDFRAAPLARDFGAQPRGPGHLILPSLHDTDGFFVAAFRRL